MQVIAHHSRRALRIAAALFPLVSLAVPTHADIFQWEYIDPNDPSQGKRPSTTLATDGADVDAVPGANLSGRDLTMAYLAGANLTGADGWIANLTSADLSQANLTNVQFAGAKFGAGNLAGASFRGANLTNANFVAIVYGGVTFPGFPYGYRPVLAALTGADFAAADTRGAIIGLPYENAATANLIRPGGHIDGLELKAGDVLVVRDYDGDPTRTSAPFNAPFGVPKPLAAIPITVDQRLAVGHGGILRMEFEADAWDSTISFAPGIPVALGGALELRFADDVNPASQVGRTFRLFDWTGVAPTGALAISSPYAWDESNLYTTGEVTLIAVPEPICNALATVCTIGLSSFRRRKIP